MVRGVFLLLSVWISAVAAKDANARGKEISYIDDDAGEYEEPVGYATPIAESASDKMEVVVPSATHEQLENIAAKHAFVEIAGEASDFFDDHAKIPKADMSEADDDDEPVSWTPPVQASPKAKLDTLEEPEAFVEAGEPSERGGMRGGMNDDDDDREPEAFVEEQASTVAEGLREHPEPLEAKAEAVPDAEPSFGLREHVHPVEAKDEATADDKPYFGIREHDHTKSSLLDTLATTFGFGGAKEATEESKEATVETPTVGLREHPTPMEAKEEAPQEEKLGLREHPEPANEAFVEAPKEDASYGLREHPEPVKEAFVEAPKEEAGDGLREHPVTVGTPEVETDEDPVEPHAFVEESEPVTTMDEIIMPASTNDMPYGSFAATGDGVDGLREEHD